MKVQLFLVQLYKAEYYRIGIEGSREEAEKYLRSVSQDVRYLNTKEKGKFDTGSRRVGKGLYIRTCDFAYELKMSNHANGLPLDNRHEVADNG